MATLAEPVKPGPGDARKKNVVIRAWDAYERGLGGAVGAAAHANGRLGAYVARRPVMVLVVSSLLAAAICAGWGRFRMETESDVLWVPQTGKARDDKDFVTVYPRSQEGASFYAQLAPSRRGEFGGNSALQLPVAWEMFKLHEKVMAVTVADDDGQPVTFADLCVRNLDGTCDNANGFLWYWSKNFTQYLADVQGSATDPTVGNFTAFKDRVSNVTYPDGEPVSLLSVFGGTTFTFNPFQISSAEVVASDYTLDDTVSDETAKRWHLAIIDLLKAEESAQQYMTYTFITGSSVGEELGKSINNDIMLVIISLLVFIVIAVSLFGQRNIVTSRVSLALSGFGLVALGIMSGWGWGMIFGMPFTPLQQLSPFILVGVGLDVVFILVKAYDIIMQREPWLSVSDAVSKLMSTAGLSVQVTLLASAVAFALGAVDELASVKWFSAFAALNTVMMLVLMMTGFIAVLVLTERRVAANRWDLLCCLRRSTAPPSSNDPALPSQPPQAWPAPQAVDRPADTKQQLGALHDDDVRDEQMVKKFFRKYYGPALSKWYVKVVVVAIFVAYAVVSLYGIYQIKYGQPLKDLAPDGSYLQDYDNVQQATYRQQVGEPIGLYFKQGVDVSQPLQQYKMLRAWDLALQNEFVNASTTAFLGSWLINFLSWAQDNGSAVAQATNNCYNPLLGKITGNLANVITPVTITGCVPQATFYTLFDQWLADNGPTNNVVRDSSGRIVTSKLPLMNTAPGDDDKYTVDLIHSIRDVEDLINDELFGAENDASGLKYNAFIYGSSFVFKEGDALLPEAALLFFILALVGVGVVTTLMLVNPAASIMLMAAVGLVILYLFGELWVLGIKFNQVSVINLICALGLAVDYIVYVAQKFMTVTADGTGNGRMRVALADTGAAVFLGGFTALCGSIPMAFARSIIIRTFFLLIFGTILFSLLVGLVLMPILFSLVPLPPVKSVLMDSHSPAPAASVTNSSSDDSPSVPRVDAANGKA